MCDDNYCISFKLSISAIFPHFALQWYTFKDSILFLNSLQPSLHLSFLWCFYYATNELQKTSKETLLWLVISRYCSRSQWLVICPKPPDQGNLSSRCCMTFWSITIYTVSLATVFLPAHIGTKHIQYARQSLSQLIDSVTSILNNSTCQLVNKEIIYWLFFLISQPIVYAYVSVRVCVCSHDHTFWNLSVWEKATDGP